MNPETRGKLWLFLEFATMMCSKKTLRRAAGPAAFQGFLCPLLACRGYHTLDLSIHLGDAVLTIVANQHMLLKRRNRLRREHTERILLDLPIIRMTARLITHTHQLNTQCVSVLPPQFLPRLQPSLPANS